MILWFGEELKTDNRDCNKAWRAFQRLLLEGIYADVRALRAGQDLISRDLKILDQLKDQLDSLRDTVDHRLRSEPFQAGLAKAIDKMRSASENVAETTQRTEQKVDAIAADLKVLVDLRPEAQVQNVPDDIQAVYDEAWALRELGKYEAARLAFQRSLEIATKRKHTVAVAKARYGLAVILNEWDRNPHEAKLLLQECLQDLTNANAGRDIAVTLHQLGVIEIDAGHLDEAEAYLTRALELDKKHDLKHGMAHTLHQLGWVADHRGDSKRALDLYAQALKSFLADFQDGTSKTAKDAIQGIAGCYQHQGLVYEHEGDVEQVEANYVHALEWHRKSGFKPDIGKILYLLARLKYREGQYEAGTVFLSEACQIYKTIGDHTWYARCTDLRGRLHFTLGELEQATAAFDSALQAVMESGDHKEEETYLNKLGHVYLEAGKVEEAKGYFIRARDLSTRQELPEGYVSSVRNLADVAHFQKNPTERNRLLSEGVKVLEKFLPSVQGEPRRAFIIGQIGSFYERMESFQQALQYYQRAKKAFEGLSDMGGVANCLGSIARMRGLLGEKKEEFDRYRELKELVDGSPYYELIAGAAINLGEIHMDMGNLDEAKMLFEEAGFLSRKYNLQYLSHVMKSLEVLADHNDLRKPPELSHSQLVEELFGWVQWFPEAKDSILRLWMWGRLGDLLAGYRQMPGIKLMVCQDDTNLFRRVASDLNLYSDLCLQVVSSEYPGSGIDVIPFPKDKKLFFDCAIPYKKKISEGIEGISFLSGGMHSRYSLTAGKTVRSRVTGNEGVTITGWSLGLPDQAHQLILSTSAADLLRKKIFFLPYERHLANDRLMADLRRSKELGFLPAYFDALPRSGETRVFASTTLRLPAMSAEEAHNLRKQLRNLKRSLSQLRSVSEDSAQSLLDSIALDGGDLADAAAAQRSLGVDVYILEYPAVLHRELHSVLVVRSEDAENDVTRFGQP